MAREAYVLIKSHKINGIERLPGSRLELPKQLGDHLVALRIADLVNRPVVIATSVQTSAQPVRQRPAPFDPPPRRGCCGQR